MSIKHQKVCATLNYIKHILFSASTITRCISISAFAYLLGIPTAIRSSAAGVKVNPVDTRRRFNVYKMFIRRR